MNKTNAQDTDTVSWYRQFWPWFLIILLTVSVVSSLITVYYAVRDPDPIVDGNYYKHGLTINEQLNDTSATKTNAPVPPPTATTGEQH